MYLSCTIPLNNGKILACEWLNIQLSDFALCTLKIETNAKLKRPDSSVAERLLGKKEVEGPIPSLGSGQIQENLLCRRLKPA